MQDGHCLSSDSLLFRWKAWFQRLPQMKFNLIKKGSCLQLGFVKTSARQFCTIYQNLKCTRPLTETIPPLGIYLTDIFTPVHVQRYREKDSCHIMYSSEKNGCQSNCPLSEESFKQMARFIIWKTLQLVKRVR